MRRYLQDLAHAARVLRRSPGFALAAIATLALGIGANTAVFSIVDAVLLRPLPVPGLDRLVVLRGEVPAMGLADTELAPVEVLEAAEWQDVFAGVAGVRAADRTLTGQGDPVRVTTATTIGDFAGVFGVRPQLGSFYRPEQSLDGPFEAAVISHGLWQQLSGGDPSFVGSTIELNGVAYEVIGVMPSDFRYPRDAQIWVPFQYTGRFREPVGRGIWNTTTVARLQPGVTPERLAARLDAEAARWLEQFAPGSEGGRQFRPVPLVDYMAGALRTILFVLMGAVGFVLLIAAANVASLFLVRGTTRAREIALHAALGADRSRLTRQLGFESLLIAAAGGAAGLWLGTIALELFTRWEPAQQLVPGSVRLDGTVLLFTGLVSLAAALAFGIIPALRGAGVDPQTVLRGTGRGTAGPGRHRLLRASVATQLALALVLLLGSTLMVRTLAALLATDPGFAAANVTTAQVTIPAARYDTGEKAGAFFDALLERLRGLPGIESAALVWGLPFTDQTDSSPFTIPTRPPQPGDEQRHAEVRIVSEDYFATMNIPLVRGRDFDGREREGAPLVAVVDETFAARYFPDGDAVGATIGSGYFGMEPATIVGVAARVDHDQLGGTANPVIYHSYRQQTWFPWRSIVVRSTLPTATVAALMRDAVSGLDPAVPLYDVQTMTERVRRSFGQRRLAMLALGAFAALSLLLAALGVYGVMRYTTGQRTREIGIRIAVGAEPQRVVGRVVAESMTTTLLGLAAGLAAALALVRFMAGMLFGVSPYDPVAFAVATLLLAAVATLAAWLPARAAAGVDPMTVLRNE